MIVFFLLGIAAVITIAGIFFAGYSVGTNDTSRRQLKERLNEMERINPEGYNYLLQDAAEKNCKSFDKYV